MFREFIPKLGRKDEFLLKCLKTFYRNHSGTSKHLPYFSSCLAAHRKGCAEAHSKIPRQAQGHGKKGLKLVCYSLWLVGVGREVDFSPYVNPVFLPRDVPWAPRVALRPCPTAAERL